MSQRRRRFRPVIALSAVALVAISLLTPAARAQDQDQAFTAGSAAGSANLLGVNIPYGGANIGFGVGEARARYFEGNAGASARSFNPGFVGLTSLLQLCGGNFPLEVPPATEADTNDSGGQPDIHDNGRTADGGSLGAESAQAYPGSRGIGDTTGQGFVLPGILSMSGGTSHAEAVLDPASQTRTVTTDVRIDRIELLDGLAVLSGVTWHLSQVVIGPDDRTHTLAHDASFAIASATLAGVPLPVGSPEQISSTLGALNAAIAPIGVQLRLPELVENGERGLRYTPLTVAVGGDTAYGSTLYPLLAGTDGLSVVNLFNELTNPLIFDAAHCEQLFGLFQANPQLNFTWNTIGVLTPILISAVAAAINGGAEIDFDLGGAITTIDDTYYPPRRRTTAAPVPDPAPAAPLPADPARVSSAPAVAAQPDTVIETVGATGPERCQTTSPVGRPRCWPGAAGLAAGLAGALTLGLLGSDELWRRREMRRIAPTERT